MQLLTLRNTWLASAISAESAGTGIDLRNAPPYGYVFYQASGQSANFDLQASHDNAGWITLATVTATATQSGQLNTSAFYPYVRVNVTEVYSGASKTGVLWVNYTPGAV